MVKLIFVIVLLLGALSLAGCEQYFAARAGLQDAIGPALCSQPPGTYTYIFDVQGDGYTLDEIRAIETLKAANCADLLARNLPE